MQIDPKDSDALYFLGKVYEEQKDFRKAFAHYQKAEELNPDNLANKAKLGRLYLIFSDDKAKVQEKIDYILAKDPENADGLLLKASKLAKDKKIPEAMALAEKIFEKYPDHVDTAAFLSSLYVNADKNKNAIDILEKAIALNGKNERLNKMLALVFVKSNDFDKAEVLYKDFLASNPDVAANYNSLAAFYNQAGKPDRAIETLRASIENDSSDVERQLTLIKYLKTQQGTESAIAELKTLISRNGGLGKLRLALAELKLLSGDKDGAITVHRQTIKDFYEEEAGVESRVALAVMYLDAKEHDKAREVVNEAASISPNDPKVNLLRARIAIFDNDLEKATIALRIVTKEAPDNINAHLLLAGVYKKLDNQDQVRDTLNNAYQSNKTNPDALLTLAQYHITRDLDQAEKIIDEYNTIKGSDYSGLSIKSSILNQKKSESEAKKISEQLIKLFPDKPNGYLQAIPYYSKQGDMQKAISVLEEGYLNTEDNRKLLILLTTLQASDNKFEIARNRVETELKSSPDDVELKLLLAKVYLSNKEVDKAITQVNEVITLKPELEEPYLLLSLIYQREHKPDMVEATLVKGAANSTASIKIPMRLATLYEAKGQYASVLETYRKLYKRNPDNLIVINNMASTISDYSDKAEDLEFAKSIIKKLEETDQAVFLDTSGWLYHKIGSHSKAIELLRKAVEKSPEINVFNYHLGMALNASGDTAQAKTYLEKSLMNGGKFKGMDIAKSTLESL